MNIDAIAVGFNPPEDINVVVEVPIGGEPIKYETLHGTSKMALDIMAGMITRRTELRIKLH